MTLVDRMWAGRLFKGCFVMLLGLLKVIGSIVLNGPMS